MLNKQPNDPDVTGVGEFVEENFFNLGLSDHPLQALNREARNDPSFRDEGRKEITGREEDVFKFRSLTMRQMKGSRTFFHNGDFTSVREVVEYFNRGAPQDEVSGAAVTLTPRFTNPRGPGSRRGLGLNRREVSDLTDFLENALFDPAFVRFDPRSTTDTFQLNERDLTYSSFRPELAALGAVDGRVASGRPQDNDDPLSRRDMGLEFLDVTDQVRVSLVARDLGGRPRGFGFRRFRFYECVRGYRGRNSCRYGRRGRVQRDSYRIANVGESVVDTHLLIVVRDLPRDTVLLNASGISSSGDPFIRVFLQDGVLRPGAKIVESLQLSAANRRVGHQRRSPRQIGYDLVLLSGQGIP